MTTMYKLPRQVDVPCVELPSCMYKMEVLNRVSGMDLSASYDDPTCVKSTPQNSQEMFALEVRQEALLERLRHLKQQLDQLQGNKGVTPSISHRTPVPVIGAAAHSSPLKTAMVHDLVISANPDMPPFSLVLLRRLLHEVGCAVYSVNHLHSSVLQVNDFLQKCFTDQPLGDRSKHKVAFTLHWKDVPEPRLMVNPLRQTQISGEANIVRYISRLFPLSSPYNYEASGTFTAITETDHLLDQLMKQLASGNNKERQAILRQLNGRLGKSTWLLGDTCSIVDVLAWSLVKQARLDSGAPANVAKWYKSMNMLVGKGLDSESPELQKLPMAQGKGVPTSNTPQDSKRQVSEESPRGGIPKNHIGRAELETYLKELNIAYQVKDHEEVFTVDALMNCVKGMPGLHMKNLFLKDKKKNLYLLSAQHNAEVKLGEVGKQIGVKDLRFGDEAVMFDVIGVKQGCVTPYALVNDDGQQVKFLLDQEALNEAHPFVNFHPMSNAASLGISPKDLNKFLNATGHKPTLLTLK